MSFLQLVLIHQSIGSGDQYYDVAATDLLQLDLRRQCNCGIQKKSFVSALLWCMVFFKFY